MIIACGVFRCELEYLSELIDEEIVWVDRSFHDYPEKLKQKLQELLLEAENRLPPGSTVLLFFGNCGGALEGLQSRTLNLMYPDVDDCIPVLLGSQSRFRELHKERPGTFYLNKSWIDSGQGPLGSARTYMKHYGEAKGWKVAKKMYTHYTHFTLIDSGCYETAPYKQHVMEACEKFEKEYSEEQSTLDFIKAILLNTCRMRKIPAGNQQSSGEGDKQWR